MLYVLATPLGNLSDLSDRAKEILRAAPVIIAENPAYTKRMVDGLGVGAKKYIQLADHNEMKTVPAALKLLQTGDAVLVSDAGTPGISDPGFKLVRAAVAEGVTVSPIPGPSAAIAALSASGLPTDRFIFLGFVPKTEVKLVRELEAAKALQATVIFYESPHRVAKTLGFIAGTWPEAHCVLARELTKIHEEFIRGSAQAVAAELAKRPSIKGEFTVLVNFKI